MPMRREDFTIDGIPEGYIVYDVDLTPSGEPVVGLASLQDGRVSAFARVGDTDIGIPDGLVRHLSAGTFVGPQIRVIGEDKILVRRGNPDPMGGDAYGQILSRSGPVGSEFPMGEPRDVLTNSRWIVATYNDQGIFGNVPLSKEGLNVFDSAGLYQWGHASTFGNNPPIAEVYAASWVDTEEIVFFPYTDFPLVRLFLRERRQEILSTPDLLHGSDAISIAGDTAYFYAPYKRDASLFAWRIGTAEARELGEFLDPNKGRPNRLRGLPGGRFIAPKPDGYTILSFD